MQFRGGKQSVIYFDIIVPMLWHLRIQIPELQTVVQLSKHQNVCHSQLIHVKFSIVFFTGLLLQKPIQSAVIKKVPGPDPRHFLGAQY